MQRVVRMKRELKLLEESPPPGICCCQKDDSITELQAQIVGGENTPYEGGLFKLDVQIPERYPFEPPKIQFITPIYHPNIDDAGRICLDSLKMPPKGAWKPALNISTLLTSIQLLMSEPNPDDPLMTDISNEFRSSRPLFEKRAREWTEKYAMEKPEKTTSHDSSAEMFASSSSSDEEVNSSPCDITLQEKHSNYLQPTADVTNSCKKRLSSDAEMESDSKRQRKDT